MQESSGENRLSQVARPFMILGCPRSGTNLMQDLIGAHPACEVQNEPFSMHTSYTRVEDLVEGGTIATRLTCHCSSCLPCELRNWLRSGATRGFKETALFAHLPLVREWMPDLKIVFIERPIEGIVRSHMKDDLQDLWNVRQSRVVRRDPRMMAMDSKDLVTTLTSLRKSMWQRHRQEFAYLEIAFEELLARPLDIVGEVMSFLGLDLHERQRHSILMRMNPTGAGNSPYGTFGRTQRASASHSAG